MYPWFDCLLVFRILMLALFRVMRGCCRSFEDLGP